MCNLNVNAASDRSKYIQFVLHREKTPSSCESDDDEEFLPDTPIDTPPEKTFSPARQIKDTSDPDFVASDLAISYSAHFDYARQKGYRPKSFAAFKQKYQMEKKKRKWKTIVRMRQTGSIKRTIRLCERFGITLSDNEKLLLHIN